MLPTEPWLNHKKWLPQGISSGAKYAHWVLGGFALFWNLVSFPLLLQLEELLPQIRQEPAMAFVFIFPLIGVGLIVAAWRSFRQWRHFGPTPLVLDPYPGALGGHVGGAIDTRIVFTAGQRFDVMLCCIYSYMSGSGKNRSRSETVKWQSDGVCHSERIGQGTRLSFRFNVPGGLPVSDVGKSGDYYLWRVSIACELDGPDFSRRYDIPVFDTGASSTISEGTESHAATVDAAMEGVESIAEITALPRGIEAFFPSMQRPGQGIGGFLFGLVFAVAGAAAGAGGAPLIFPLVFISVGGLIAGWGVYYLGKSLRVSVTAEGVTSRRFLFGFPLSHKLLTRATFTHFEIDQGATMQSGSKTTVYYRLYANGQGAAKSKLRFPVAERLSSRSEAELLKETFETYLSV
jgi:hypothetical protein